MGKLNIVVHETFILEQSLLPKFLKKVLSMPTKNHCFIGAYQTIRLVFMCISDYYDFPSVPTVVKQRYYCSVYSATMIL